MSNKRIVYKVTGASLESVFAQNEWSLKYGVGELTKPTHKGSRIFCFDSLKNARDFTKKTLAGDCLRIFKAEAYNTIRQDSRSHLYDSLAKYWKGKAQKILDTPAGTLSATSIRLLKELP